LIRKAIIEMKKAEDKSIYKGKQPGIVIIKIRGYQRIIMTERNLILIMSNTLRKESNTLDTLPKHLSLTETRCHRNRKEYLALL
jgi:hypothetical protein